VDELLLIRSNETFIYVNGRIMIRGGRRADSSTTSVRSLESLLSLNRSSVIDVGWIPKVPYGFSSIQNSDWPAGRPGEGRGSVLGRGEG
jgi:hypothetical protein